MNDFDVDAFVRMVDQTGADYIIFTGNHDNRDIIPADMFGKITGAQLQRMGREQRLAALPAARCILHALRRYPVNGCAVWTDYM